ncbi:unnamed protein product, partial [Darwinula stevensoni]
VVDKNFEKKAKQCAESCFKDCTWEGYAGLRYTSLCGGSGSCDPNWDDALKAWQDEIKQLSRGYVCIINNPPCHAYNYRESDGSCQLVTDSTSDLVEDDEFQAFAEIVCLMEHPRIEGAKAIPDKGWDGKYPSPKGVMVTFTCENPQGFTDGSQKHSATCAVKDPDSWFFNLDFQHIRCESPVRDIYYMLNHYRASVARGEVKGCLDCDGNPLPTALNMNELASLPLFPFSSRG